MTSLAVAQGQQAPPHPNSRRIDDSPQPGTSNDPARPAGAADRGGPCDLDPRHLLDVWARQRQRFAEVLRGFGQGDWAAPTLLRDRLAQGHRFGVQLSYGPMDWTVLVLHGFWDSWLHERDVLLAQGRDHPTCGDATIYVAAYPVTRGTTAGPPAAEVADALAGRPPAAVLGDLSAGARATLSRMANFFNTSVPPSPP